MVRENSIKEGLDNFFNKTGQKDKLFDTEGEVLGRLMFESYSGKSGVFHFVAKDAETVTRIMKMSGDEEVLIEGANKNTPFYKYKKDILERVEGVYSSPLAYYSDQLPTWLIGGNGKDLVNTLLDRK